MGAISRWSPWNDLDHRADSRLAWTNLIASPACTRGGARAGAAELYHKFNCVGCHFDGGGGIGPALIDDEWIYGSSIDHIAATIRQGRPNGMPSFHAVLKDEEIWQLAAYIEDGLKEHPHGEKAADHEHRAKGDKADGEKSKQSKDEAPKHEGDGGAKDHHH